MLFLFFNHYCHLNICIANTQHHMGTSFSCVPPSKYQSYDIIIQRRNTVACIIDPMKTLEMVLGNVTCFICLTTENNLVQLYGDKLMCKQCWNHISELATAVNITRPYSNPSSFDHPLQEILDRTRTSWGILSLINPATPTVTYCNTCHICASKTTCADKYQLNGNNIICDSCYHKSVLLAKIFQQHISLIYFVFNHADIRRYVMLVYTHYCSNIQLQKKDSIL